MASTNRNIQHIMWQ